MRRARRTYRVTVSWPDGKTSTVNVKAFDYLGAEKIVRKAAPEGVSYRAVLAEGTKP